MPRKKAIGDGTPKDVVRVYHPVFGHGSALLRLSEALRPVADVIFDDGTARCILQSVLQSSDVPAPAKTPKPKAKAKPVVKIADKLLVENDRDDEWPDSDSELAVTA